MLAIDYFAAWYQCPMRLTLPLAAKAEIDCWGISTAGVDWVDGEVDYLNLPFYLNMTQDPEMYIRQTEKGVEHGDSLGDDPGNNRDSQNKCDPDSPSLASVGVAELRALALFRESTLDDVSSDDCCVD